MDARRVEAVLLGFALGWVAQCEDGKGVMPGGHLQYGFYLVHALLDGGNAQPDAAKA